MPRRTPPRNYTSVSPQPDTGLEKNTTRKPQPSTIKYPVDLISFDEDSAKRIANIIGPQSAAAQALKKLADLRAAGREGILMHSTSLGSFFVFDDPEALPDP